MRTVERRDHRLLALDFQALQHVFIYLYFLNNLFQGFGFVTFSNADDAERARQTLNGAKVEGRTIEVGVVGRTSNMKAYLQTFSYNFG